MSDVTKPADVELQAIEAAAVQLAERMVALTAKHKAVADELLEKQKISGLGANPGIRTWAFEQAKTLAAKEYALREEMNHLRVLQARWKERLDAARLRAEEAELMREATKVVAQTTDEADRRRRREQADNIRRNT